MTQKTYHKQTAELLAKVAQSIPGMMNSYQMQSWIDNPHSLKKFMMGLVLPQVWRTVKIGTYKHAGDLHKAVKVNMYDSECKLIDKIEVCAEQKELDLVIVSPRELGFEQCPSHEWLCKKVKSLGLELCPPEVGPQVFLQHRELLKTKNIEDKDQTIIFGMEPVDGQIFAITGYLRELTAASGSGHPAPSWTWWLDELFVFVKPRPQSQTDKDWVQRIIPPMEGEFDCPPPFPKFKETELNPNCLSGKDCYGGSCCSQ